MTAEERWLAALWPKIRSCLPPPPAVAVEIGRGRFGGFVPQLHADGYDGVGIDPVAPEAESYRRVEFERSDLPADLEAVIACTSLRHVADPTRFWRGSRTHWPPVDW